MLHSSYLQFVVPIGQRMSIERNWPKPFNAFKFENKYSSEICLAIASFYLPRNSRHILIGTWELLVVRLRKLS